MRFFAFLFHSSVPKSLSSSPVESGDVKGIGASPKRVGCDVSDIVEFIDDDENQMTV